MVFVDHYANPATALIFKAPDYAAMAVNLHVTTRTHNFSREHDGEIHHRAHWHVAIHRKEHAVGGDVLRLRSTSSTLRRHLHSQMQRKPRRTLHCRIVLALRLLWNRQFLPRLGCHDSIEPFFRIFQGLKGSLHPGIRCAKLLKSWNGRVLTAFGLPD